MNSIKSFLKNECQKQGFSVEKKITLVWTPIKNGLQKGPKWPPKSPGMTFKYLQHLKFLISIIKL